ncbi:MAG: hypothetical protein N2482_01825 [Patescibacteria group bacterium]|nr:hypothetical protein [Patescibacteria group bacterium]
MLIDTDGAYLNDLGDDATLVEVIDIEKLRERLEENGGIISEELIIDH